jgi:hypothetical protein
MLVCAVSDCTAQFFAQNNLPTRYSSVAQVVGRNDPNFPRMWATATLCALSLICLSSVVAKLAAPVFLH